jgi:RNA polymerase sigma-70 factor (ECF subfamily)
MQRKRSPTVPRQDTQQEPPLPRSIPPDFHAAYTEHFDFVWRSLRLLGTPADLLDDAAQDVFGVVYRRLADFDGGAAFRTWLFAIARRVAANYRRRESRRLTLPSVRLETEPSGEPTPHAHLEASESAVAVMEYCATLDDERRALFVLALIEGVATPELVPVFSVPLNTLYSRIRALREGLEQFLEHRERAR